MAWVNEQLGTDYEYPREIFLNGKGREFFKVVREADKMDEIMAQRPVPFEFVKSVLQSLKR